MLTETELILTYREHTKQLYGYVSRRAGGDRPLVEDIVQETWLRAVDAWRRRGAPDQPGAWLARVAHNLLVSHFRRRTPTPVDPAELDLVDDRVRPETPWAAALVNWGLTRLRRRQAELLEAFYFDGKSTREIAAESGLSERAVEGRLRRARHNLRKHLRPHVVPAPSAMAVPERSPAAEAGLKMVEGGNNHA